MHGWLIYGEKEAVENESYIRWFINEGAKQNVQIELIFREQLHVGIKNGTYVIFHNGKPVQLPRFVVIRTIEPILQYVFETLHVPTFNESTIASTANHKAWTYIELHKLGIPILPTFFARKKTFPETSPFSFPVVVKEATGRGGKQVFYVKNKVEWENVKNSLHTEDVIIQNADVQLGKDLRVFVIGKKIIAAILRKNEHDFRANFKLGGTAHIFNLKVEQKRMIQKIIDHFNFGLVGIDFLFSHENKLIFNEIEDVVGSRILSATTDINLLEKYVSHIKYEVQKSSQ